jgi:hypothetical protein
MSDTLDFRVGCSISDLKQRAFDAPELIELLSALQSRIDELVAFVGRVAKEQSIGYLPTSDPHIFEDAKLLAQRLIKESKK